MQMHGKRVLITRPYLLARHFAEGLRALGAIPIIFPAIDISPIRGNNALDHALQNLGHYAWLVLTSANGVEVVWRRMNELGIKTLPAGLRVAAIGPKTGAALRRAGVQPDFVPREYVAEAILPGLGDLNGRWVLLLRADLARPALPQAIGAAGGIAHEIAVYKTLPGHPDSAALKGLKQGVDVVTFTSSSTVRNFVALVKKAGFEPPSLPGDPLFACIGPITARAARQEGFPVRVIAEEYTTEGLLQALLDHPG